MSGKREVRARAPSVHQNFSVCFRLLEIFTIVSLGTIKISFFLEYLHWYKLDTEFSALRHICNLSYKNEPKVEL
jgi:hypothetical protein